MGKFLEVVTAVCLLRKAQPFVKAQSPSSLHILLSQHPQLHSSSAKSLLPTGLTWPDPRRCAYSPVTEIRPVVLEQMSSVSPALFLVCLLPWPISCFHSAKWLVSHCNPLRWEDKGSIRSTAWSNVPKHLIKSSSTSPPHGGSVGSPSCRHLFTWPCLKPSSVTPMRRLAGLG